MKPGCGWGPGASALYDHGQSTIPPGLFNVAAIADGFDYSLTLRADGTVAAWGNDDYRQTSCPRSLSNVLAISAQANASQALVGRAPSVPRPIILPAPMVLGAAGQPFYHRVMARNNPHGFGTKGLPAGLSINPKNGLITGAVSQPGIHQVTLTATNEFGTGEKTLAIRINSQAPYWPSNPRVPTLASGAQRLTFILGGQVGRACQVEQSVDLVDWQPLTTLTNTTGPVVFQEDLPAGRKARFFRAWLKE